MQFKLLPLLHLTTHLNKLNWLNLISVYLLIWHIYISIFIIKYIFSILFLKRHSILHKVCGSVYPYTSTGSSFNHFPKLCWYNLTFLITTNPTNCDWQNTECFKTVHHMRVIHKVSLTCLSRTIASSFWETSSVRANSSTPEVRRSSRCTVWRPLSPFSFPRRKMTVLWR